MSFTTERAALREYVEVQRRAGALPAADAVVAVAHPFNSGSADVPRFLADLGRDLFAKVEV